MKGWTKGWMLSLVVAGVSLAGCSKSESVAVDEGNQGSSAQASAANTAGPAKERKPHHDPQLHLSFQEAVLPQPPEDRHRPPDVTMTGKSVGKLYTEVVEMWDKIEFTAEDKTCITYRARLETDLGPIVIELKPEWAPNHVRSFIALARTGYYDGLVFERIVKDASTQVPAARLEMIEGGCPLGTGAMGYGSIGYWLRPEFSEDAAHVPGAVGACNSAEEDAGACRFYINLCEAPFLDGHFTVFGKVVSGLDVARNIHNQPVRQDAEYPAGDRPMSPVIIRKVTIEAQRDEQITRK